MLLESDLKVIEAMEKYGGSFVVALAGCFRCADPGNIGRLQSAFSELWFRYRKMANSHIDKLSKLENGTG